MPAKLTMSGRVLIGVAGAAVIAAAALFLYPRLAATETLLPYVYDGDAAGLQATTVALTLEEPLGENRNVIWCASFLAAWKRLEKDIAKEPLVLEQSPELAAALSGAADPRDYTPEESLYAAAGRGSDGITAQIAADLARRFPEKPAVEFPELLPDGILAYGYLQSEVNFTLSYEQGAFPLKFSDAQGEQKLVQSFGITGGVAFESPLRKQPAILYETLDEHYELTEFVIDLDHTSQPDQIVLARVTPAATLAATLAAVDEKVAGSAAQSRVGLDENDVLRVPDMAWRISRLFTELEGQQFTNQALSGLPIQQARQDLEFRLSRTGAALKAESGMVAEAIPRHYIFDRPFLLYMKQRGVESPYFVMWVDNAELLAYWSRH